ncbi:MAG: hypothetical protein NTX49_01555 [Chlamydiae bacterium]|nr:hypothetical protein [Chlamydiota bacterium]
MNAIASMAWNFGASTERGVTQALCFTNRARGASTSQKVAIVSAAVILGIAMMASMQKGSFIEHLKTPATKYWPFSDAVLIRGFNVDTLDLSGKMGTVGPRLFPGESLQKLSK